MTMIMGHHPASRYTHPACDECWRKRHGDRVPNRLNVKLRAEEVCCCCGGRTTSGIYVRGAPCDLLFCEARID